MLVVAGMLSLCYCGCTQKCCARVVPRDTLPLVLIHHHQHHAASSTTAVISGSNLQHVQPSQFVQIDQASSSTSTRASPCSTYHIYSRTCSSLPTGLDREVHVYRCVAAPRDHSPPHQHHPQASCRARPRWCSCCKRIPFAACESAFPMALWLALK